MSQVSKTALEADHKAAQIELYPSVGRRIPGDSAWQVAVSGRVVRPWLDNLQKRVVLQLLRRTMRIDSEQMKSPVLEDRLADFWIKPCRGQRVRVQIGNAEFDLTKRSRGSGHFLSNVRVPFTVARQTDECAGDLSVTTVDSLAPNTAIERSRTSTRLIPSCGTSVISDIDDTIKISEVHDRRRMFANAFLNPYEPVPQMARLYQGWAEQGSEFHYVSSSPWQLYRPLQSFLAEHQFPPGSFHLRPFRLRDPNNVRIKLAGTRSKRKAIRSLLKWYPFRQFVLVGDGGEKDAKLYSKIAVKHGHQIAQICIRRLPHSNPESERIVREALRVLPQSKWRLFEYGDELTYLKGGSKLGWGMG